MTSHCSSSWAPLDDTGKSLCAHDDEPSFLMATAQSVHVCMCLCERLVISWMGSDWVLKSGSGFIWGSRRVDGAVGGRGAGGKIANERKLFWVTADLVERDKGLMTAVLVWLGLGWWGGRLERPEGWGDGRGWVCAWGSVFLCGEGCVGIYLYAGARKFFLSMRGVCRGNDGERRDVV